MSQASRRLRHHADGDSRRERCLRRGGIGCVGLAKCADCTRKNMKAEAAFKGKIDVYIVMLATLLNDDQSILDVLMAP